MSISRIYSVQGDHTGIHFGNFQVVVHLISVVVGLRVSQLYSNKEIAKLRHSNTLFVSAFWNKSCLIVHKQILRKLSMLW